MNRKINAVALLAATVLAVSACGGEDPKVSGVLDEVAFKAGKPGKLAKTHVESTTRTERSCASRNTKGSCTSWSRRSVPDTKVVTDAPAKPGKPNLYCVELDNVNGKPNQDDRWFEVSGTTYHEWADKGEGTKVTNMVYLREVDSCKH